MIEDLTHRLISQVRHVEHHAESLHLPEQRDPRRLDRPWRTGAVAVTNLALVRETENPQTLVPPEREVIRREDRVRALHADDEAQRRSRVGFAGFIPLPRFDVL